MDEKRESKKIPLYHLGAWLESDFTPLFK
jgi:hypothetical protein